MTISRPARSFALTLALAAILPPALASGTADAATGAPVLGTALGIGLGTGLGIGIGLGTPTVPLIGTGTGVPVGTAVPVGTGVSVGLGGVKGTTTVLPIGAPTSIGVSSGTTPISPGGSLLAGALPILTPPVAGTSVALAPAGGTVLVKLPGRATPVPLAGGASVPPGSIIDASHGTVELTSVRDASGVAQTARFWGGAFQVRQAASGSRITELLLVGGDFRGCARPARRARVTSAGVRGRVITRHLWGSDSHGNFRTRGRYGTATVRGTVWLTEDRCDGTRFKVTRGAITVRDFGRARRVPIRTGRSYLARARR